MTEDNIMTAREKWQTKLGLAGLAVAVLTPLISLYIYMDRDDAQQVTIWEDRRTVYKDLTENLGNIAADLEEKNEISAELRYKLNQAYWAKLPSVASDEVEQEMVKFRNDLQDFDAGMVDSDKLKWRILKIVGLTKKHISSE